MKGIRTIALRLTGTKEAAEELEEMGEDTSDMIMSQSKMRELIMNATKVASNDYKGFDIQDELGRYKSTYEIMLGLAQIWDEIQQADFKTGDNRQNLLLESIAGKNRASIAASILQNPETLQSVYEDSSTKAAGSAMEENQKYLDSISGHLAKLQNAWQEMWANAANRDIINMFIDLATVLLNVINKVGLLGSAFAVVWGGSVIKSFATADSWLVKIIRGLNDASNSGKTFGQIIQDAFNFGKKGDTRWKGLAQINEDNQKRQEREQLSAGNASITAPVSVNKQREKEKDESIAREKAEVSREAAQANLEEVTSEEKLQTANSKNAQAEAEETTAKAQGIATSQQAAQSNIQEAETTEMAAQALMKKELADAKQEVYWTQGLPDKFSNRQQKQIEQMAKSAFDFDTIIPKMQKEGGKGVMDWSMQYIDGLEDIGDEAWKTGQEISQMGQNISTGFGAIGTTLAGLATNPITWLVGIPAAIGLATTAIDYFAQREQALVDGAKEASTEWGQFESNLTNYEQQYTDLAKQLENQNLSEAETLDIKEQIFSLQKQITDEYGKSADGINLVNGNLDDQLEKLRQLRVESQAENYTHNNKEYDNSIKKMGESQLYNQMTLTRSEDDEDYVKQLKDAVKDTAFVIESTEDGLSFKLHENAEASEEDLNVLQEALTKVQKQMGADWDGSMFEEFNSEVSKTIKTNDAFLAKYKESRDTGLEGKFFSLADSQDQSMYFDYQQAQSDYNQALLSGDDKKIAETQEKWRKLQAQRDEYLNAPGTNNQQFKPLFDQYDKEVNESFERAYEVRKQMESDENKTLVEQAFGDYKENRKVSKENQKAVLEASKAVLEEWKRASKNNKEVDMGSTAMQNLAKAAKDANIPISTIVNSLQSTGGTSALQQSMEGTRITAEEMKTAFLEGNEAITGLASQFGIDFNSPEAEIDNFINKMAAMSGAIGDTTNQSESSLDRFYKTTSAKIEQLSSLTSTLQKGQSQTGLTFTKTLDEKGNQVASEVQTIIDAYKDLEGFDLGSLFEETATGVKLNYDAYRALAAEEEAEVKRQYKLERAALANQLATATGDKKAELQKQITELDMLSSAYDGATSALQKYLNQQNASDYGDTYAMLRDTTIKRADELMNKGMVGTEEFRSIAQLFSFDSLATADADKVVDSYLAGYEKVKKFFTEDNFTGMQTFADELTTLDEKFGSFTKETVNGEDIYKFEASDDQLALLAEHYGVSVDLIESLFDQLRAMGFNLHLYRDGGFEDFEKLDKQIEDSQNALKELKKTANDPNLIPDDLFNFNAKDLDTPEELKQKIEDLQNIQTKLPVNSEEYKEAQKIIENLQAKLKEFEEHDEYSPKVTVTSYEQANEILGQFAEKEKTIQQMTESDPTLNIKATIQDDPQIQDFISTVEKLPPQVQTYIMAGLNIEGFDPVRDKDRIGELITQALQTDETVEVGIDPKISHEAASELMESEVDVKVRADTTDAKNQLEAGPFANPRLNVGVDPASEEAAKQEVTDTVGSAEADVGVHTHLASSAEDLKPLTQLASNGDIHLNLDADASQASEVIENTKNEAEKETEMPLVLKAENTAQDAANQAGVQQGVQTTNHETTIKDEQINTTVTSDTSQVDAANQTVSNLKAMSGSNVSIGLSVDGTEDVEKAKDSIDNLTSQKNPKVKVTINGNSAQFNKTSSDVTNKLNALGKKVTTPKISADNSRLSSKVSDSKSKLSSIKDKPVRITASQTGFSTISSWKSSVYDKLSNKTITIKTKYTTEGKPNGGSGFQGSAHSQGTVISKGHAYASGTLSGDWGLPKAEKGALVNELGSEVIVTPNGHWQILNGGDPTFANLPKGSIIFNHKQSESLLKKGYINGSHGKMVGGAFANGTVDDEDFDEEEFEGNAYAIGTTGWNGQLSGMSHAGTAKGSFGAAKKGKNKSSSSSSKKSSGSGKKSSGKSGKKSSGNSSSNKSSKDNLQTLDAIEIRLNRIDALISQLDTNAGKTYSTFANRNSALVQDLATVQKEINAINSSLSSKSHVYNYLAKASAAAKEAGLKSGDEGYKKRSQGASGTALSDKWIKRIQNSVNSGQYFTINDVRDEGLWKKIQAYQTWYEKYVKLQQKVQEQTNKLSQLTIQQLTLIQTKWETTLNNIASNITKLQNNIDLITERGYDVAEGYYSGQITENQNRIKNLTNEASELQAQLNAAVKAGRIQQYSEEWYKWYIQIKNINNEIIATNKEIQSLVNSIRQLRWDRFDRGQEELSNLADEMEFLGDLINEIDLFDKDTGLVTDKGKAAFALEAQRYDIYIKQAKKYGEAVKRLNADIAKDPNNKTLIEQRNEWLKAQQDAISNAHSQKEAIADLVEKGIKKQIEVMEDLIDKYEDALDAEKEQQKYAESIAKKQKEINSLQKQLKSMEGDDSEEGATKRQKLRDQLKEAQKDLEDTQEDQRISDIKDALSTMQEKYEEVLNARLDNIDALLTEVVSGVNQSGADIVSTLRDVASSVDYSLSGSLNNIYTGVQNLSANVANVAGQVGALVTATSTSNGSVDNTSATTYAKTPTPTVPTTPTVADYTPKPTASSSTGSGSTVAKSTTTPAKTTAKAKNGLITEGGQTYYYKNNKKQTGWQTVGGKKYYFSTKNGAMLKDVQKIGNTYYLLDKTTGVLKSTYTGLYKTGSSTYYFKSGAIQTGWRDMKEGRRYFSVNSGKMLTGKQKIGNDEYYFNSNGILQIGKFNVDGYTFETDKNGKIKKRTKAAGGNLALKGSSNNSKKAVSTAASKGLKIQGGFAKGTKNVNRAGMYRVDEEGQEVFINKNGKIYTRLDKGTAVLPHDAAVNLLKGMSNPVDFIASHMDMRPNKNITNTNNTTGDIVNNITFNIPNVTNYKEFMQEAQRDPNFTKYIQELSIGRLNGNNSLKGNSIRFR